MSGRFLLLLLLLLLLILLHKGAKMPRSWNCFLVSLVSLTLRIVYATQIILLCDYLSGQRKRIKKQNEHHHVLVIFVIVQILQDEITRIIFQIKNISKVSLANDLCIKRTRCIFIFVFFFSLSSPKLLIDQ